MFYSIAKMNKQMEQASREKIEKDGYTNLVVVHGSPMKAIKEAEERRAEILRNFDGIIPKGSRSEAEYHNLAIYIQKVKNGEYQHAYE